MVSLFELQDGKIVLTEICYTNKTFKEVMKVFKKDKNYMKVFLVLFYLTCPDKKRNAYWDLPEYSKEEVIFRENEIDFSIDEPIYAEALALCQELYKTPTRRFFLDCKIGLEKQGKYLRETEITFGRDGNDTTYLGTLKSIGVITQQFMQVQKMYDEELGAALRGGGESGYDE